MSWELWNEVDFVDGYNQTLGVSWHTEMGQYMHCIDPTDRMVTTSFALEKGDPAVEALPELNYLTTHHYDNITYGGDMGAFLGGLCALKAAQFPHKPHYIGEFGVGPTPWEMDPSHAALHNGTVAAVALVSLCPSIGRRHLIDAGCLPCVAPSGLWASMMTQSAGAASPWFWQALIDDYDLYVTCGRLGLV